MCQVRSNLALPVWYVPSFLDNGEEEKYVEEEEEELTTSGAASTALDWKNLKLFHDSCLKPGPASGLGLEEMFRVYSIAVRSIPLCPHSKVEETT